jgi:hypothetical protein
MDLVREVLDKQVIDRGRTHIGKVDSIVVELREGKPPRVVAIEIGSIALMRRLGPRAERWMTKMASKLGGSRHSRPHRISWAKVRDIGHRCRIRHRCQRDSDLRLADLAARPCDRPHPWSVT